MNPHWTFRFNEMSAGCYSCEASRYTGHNFSRTGFEPAIAQTLFDAFDMEIRFGTSLGEAAFLITASYQDSWHREYHPEAAGSWSVVSPRPPRRVIYEGGSLHLVLYGRSEHPVWQGHVADLQVPAAGYFTALASLL